MWARGAWKRLEGLVSLWHPVLRCDPFLTHMLPPWGDAANSALAREKPVPVWWPGASGLHEISLPWGIYCSNKDQTGAIAKATEGIGQLTWRRYSFSTNGDYIQEIHMNPKLCTKLILKWVKSIDVRQRPVHLERSLNHTSYWPLFGPWCLILEIWF